jgi:uncharacterized ferritin-like protein (DUF455 family)
LQNLFELVRDAFLTADIDTKLKRTRTAAAAYRDGKASMDEFGEPAPVETPGRPERPLLVRAKHVPKRGFGTDEGRAIMMHAIAHIEFNAINLALDAVQRFDGMPEQFYADWLKVAEEEAYHFELIRAHMRHLGRDYGDYDAHDGLWEMCTKTAHDVLTRMALVPRVLEARGLDVTPGIQQKLTQVGDLNAVSLLDIILRDEIGHVEIGNRWFRHCCRERGLKTEETFFTLLAEYYPKGLMGPYNLGAREQAGFSKSEIEMLTASF